MYKRISIYTHIRIIYIHIYIYIYLYIHNYICTYTHIYICIYTYIHTLRSNPLAWWKVEKTSFPSMISLSKLPSSPVYTYINVHVYIHYINMNIYMYCIHIYTYICTRKKRFPSYCYLSYHRHLLYMCTFIYILKYVYI
jgi:hypothetical protein